MPRKYEIELSDEVVELLDTTLAQVREISRNIADRGDKSEVILKALTSTDQEFLTTIVGNGVAEMAKNLIEVYKGAGRQEDCDCPSCQLEQEMKSGSDMGDKNVMVMSASADISQFN